MCHTMPFSARALKKHFDIVVKINRNAAYHVPYSYWQWVHVITLFPNIFSYCFCTLKEFAKGFERKVWHIQVVYLHNAARAFSSPSRCFQLSANFDKDFFLLSLILWWKTNQCGLVWSVLLLTNTHHQSWQNFDHCDDVYSVSIRVKTTLNHIQFVKWPWRNNRKNHVINAFKKVNVVEEKCWKR